MFGLSKKTMMQTIAALAALILLNACNAQAEKQAKLVYYALPG